MFSKRVKHYHQWLCSAIPFKAKLDQISSDSIRVQGPTKRPSLGHLYPVSPVKERHRKGGKCKISRVLQSPVPSTQASPKVEASHKLKQAQHFSTRRKVQNGKWTIDGYRTAIVDTLGPMAQHIAHNADLHRLLSSFHRDRPKSSRNLPKWNHSVVLNELTKPPFEPMKDTDLKHLTLKTALLLALASGKRRSEIHARVANKVSNLGQWEKVALFPSSDFIAKNQLAREGSQSVSPVTIPALTTIVDRQFKEDRTLCPVRALRFYLDRTKDLRGSRSLLFISFKKGHTSDIRPATLSSWLKQTILLCYKQADQQALDLVQVKAHDIRAFAASKAFYGGVSVDQIMQACHWKAHNTFTKKGGGGGGILPLRPVVTSATTKSSGVFPRI